MTLVGRGERWADSGAMPENCSDVSSRKFTRAGGGNGLVVFVTCRYAVDIWAIVSVRDICLAKAGGGISHESS